MPPTRRVRSKTLIDLYDSFDNKENVSLKQYTTILKTFNYLLMESMVKEGKVYYIPQKLGVMGIFKESVKGRGVFDYKLFNTTGLKVWKKNLHSSSYVGKFLWIKKFPRFEMSSKIKRMFKWEPPRYWKRRLSAEIKNFNSINRYYDKNDY